MTSRPDRSWIPVPGPVPYHVHLGSRAVADTSRNSFHVLPESVLEVTRTRVRSLLVPATIPSSVSDPRLRVRPSHTAPALRSRSRHGLPRVLSPSAATTASFDHVLPRSVLRFSTMSI